MIKWNLMHEPKELLRQLVNYTNNTDYRPVEIKLGTPYGIGRGLVTINTGIEVFVNGDQYNCRFMRPTLGSVFSLLPTDVLTDKDIPLNEWGWAFEPPFTAADAAVVLTKKFGIRFDEVFYVIRVGEVNTLMVSPKWDNLLFKGDITFKLREDTPAALVLDNPKIITTEVAQRLILQKGMGFVTPTKMEPTHYDFKKGDYYGNYSELYIFDNFKGWVTTLNELPATTKPL